MFLRIKKIVARTGDSSSSRSSSTPPRRPNPVQKRGGESGQGTEMQKKIVKVKTEEKWNVDDMWKLRLGLELK